MQFLLVALNTKYIHSNPAIYSLRAYAGEELGKHVELAEYTINNSLPEILADIYKRRPDVIGFSCYIWNISMILDLVVEINKLLPQVPIWLGGPEVTYDAPQLLKKYPMVTGVMIGEGEATFKELLEHYVSMGEAEDMRRQEPEGYALEKKAVCGVSEKESVEKSRTGLKNIPGLCLPQGYTAPRELTDISSLPFLYNNLEDFENKIIYYESSRGCPFRCSYCLSSIDKKVRLRDIGVVKKELQFFLDNRVKQVKFVDRTFNCNHQHAMEIWRYILEHDNGVTNFHFEISADILNDEEIRLLNQMRPGLAQLEIGVQSTNPETIQAIHRTMNVEKLEQIVAAINAGKNVHQHLDLIAGLPYEDYETFAKSFNRVYAMQPEQLQLGFLKVLKGSEMYDRAKEYGICYMDKPPYEVMYTKWLTFEDVLKLKQIEEMVELYYNSNQFVYTLPYLERVFKTPFEMYETLAQFYEENGYFVASPARSYRYHVLLNFALKYDAEHVAVYKELLTYDMYLRENLKSRPDFACDLKEYKEAIREFYIKEEQERRYLPDYTAYDSKQLSRMTHLEPFYYPVWEMVKGHKENCQVKSLEQNPLHENGSAQVLPKIEAAATLTYVLFDYNHRNPLNSEARTVRIVNE